MRYALGVDGGGSGCRAALLDETGRELGRGAGGPANVATDFETALANVRFAIHEAAKSAGALNDIYPRTAAVLGLAGASVGANAQRLAEALAFHNCRVVSDALISLEGALGEKDGTGAIIGTGSVFASRKDGAYRQLGGWGFQVGDQASGAQIGRSALQETLLAHDGIRPRCSLTEAVLERFGGAAGITEFARRSAPSDYAALAPLVVSAGTAGDAAALSILQEACSYIEKAVRAAAYDEAMPVVMIGGLSQSLTDFLPPWIKLRLAPSEGNALDGAARMALKLLNSAAQPAPPLT